MHSWLKHFKNASLTTKLVYLLAASLPFEHLPTLELDSLNVRISTLIGGLLILLSLPGLVRLISARRASVLELALMAWIVWLGLGLVWGSSLHDGLIAYLPLLFLVVMSLAVRLNLGQAALRQVIWWLVGGSLLAIVFGVYQFIGNLAGLSQSYTGLREEYTWQRFGFPRFQSVGLEPLYFSATLLLPLSILSALIIRHKNNRFWKLAAVLLLVVTADALTVSRGGLAAAALALLVIAVSFYRNWRQMLKVIAVVAIGVAAAAGIIALASRPGQDPRLTYGTTGVGTLTSHLGDFRITPNTTNTVKNDSISQRALARHQARQIINDYPRVMLVGAGIGQYHDFAKAHYKNPDTGEPNNVLIEQLVQTGLVGLGLLLTVLILLLRGLWRVARTTGDSYTQALAVGLMAFILGIGLQAQTFTGLIITPLWFAVGLALFLIQSEKQTKHKHHEKLHSKKA